MEEWLESQTKERLRELAEQIASEQDHEKFTALVQELNQLLDGEERPAKSTGDSVVS
jgi:hypothetical protein